MYRHDLPSRRGNNNDDYSIEMIKTILNEFQISLEEAEQDSLDNSTITTEEIITARNALNVMNSYEDFQWMPSFGYVLMIDGKYKTDELYLRLMLLIVDCDRFDGIEHGDSSELQNSQFAVTDDYFIISCGQIPNKKKALEALETGLNKMLNQRSRADDDGGQKYRKIALRIKHMIERVVDTINEMDSVELNDKTGDEIIHKHKSRGGTANYNNYLGCSPRNLCWSLISSVFKELVPSTAIFVKIVLHFHMFMLSRSFDSLKSSHFMQQDVTTTFSILDDLVVKVFTFKIEGKLLGIVLKEVKNARLKLDSLQREFSIHESNKFLLPAIEKMDFSNSTQAITQQKDRAATSTNSVMSPKIWKESCDRIGCFKLSINQKSAQSLVTWTKNACLDTKIKYTNCLILNNLDLFMFKLSDRLGLDYGQSYLGYKETAALVQLVEKYAAILELISSNSHQGILRVQYRSHHVLITWLVYCLLHNDAVQDHRLLAEYGIALKADDLSHLVTNDKAACKAIFFLTCYIRRWTKINPVFCSQDPSSAATIEFSQKFGNADAKMVSRWKLEEKKAKKRENLHWNQVTAKKSEAQQLKSALDDAKAELDDDSYDCWEGDGRIVQQEKIARLQGEYDAACKAPPPVINPLPETMDLAMPVIFYILMPQDLDHLSYLAFLAQSTLNTCSLDRVTVKCTWAKHYNRYKSNDMPSIKDRKIIFFPYNYNLPSVCVIGPQNVECISRPAEGTWYPMFNSRINAADENNPFVTSESALKKWFTEVMPNDSTCTNNGKLQWALNHPASAVKNQDRGNVGYSVQCNAISVIPDGFDKRSFLSLASLRSFPKQQFRKISMALEERSMPFCNPIILCVIRQAMYHVGPVEEYQDAFVWRQDLFHDSHQEYMLNQLELWCDELRETPRKHRIFRTLSEMTSFLSQWSETSSAVQKFANVARGWADKQQSLYRNAGENLKLSLEHRVKECLMIAYCISCYSLCELDENMASLLCSMAVRFHHSLIYVNELNVSSSNVQFCREMEAICTHVLTRQVYDLVKFAHENPFNVLTLSIQKVFPRTSSTLNWKQLRLFGQSDTTCFHSTCDGDVYMINVLTGCVLKNGMPPGRLPSCILSSEFYSRSFGIRNFEVSVGNDQKEFKTMYPIDKFNYDFHLDSTFKHCEKIVEVWPNKRLVMELIDPSTVEIANEVRISNDSKIWMSNLPCCVYGFCSFWYCQELNVILLRPIQYNDRRIHYIVQLSPKPRCVQIPKYREKDSLEAVLTNIEEFPMLVDVPMEFLEILEKFELVHYIHGLLLNSKFSIHLPRFQLQFTINDGGRLYSDDYAGFQLAESQQMKTIPWFHQYLILERIDTSDISLPPYKLLVPCGHACLEDDSIVQIKINDSFKETFRVFDYDFHHRFNVFRCKTVESRLLLASIFALASSPITDEWLGMTAADAAIDLVRQSMIGNPFSDEEALHLIDIMHTCERRGFFSLQLVCQDIIAHSNRLGFLFANQSSPKEISVFETREFRRLKRNALTAYMLRMRKNIPWNEYRLGLTKQESDVLMYCPIKREWESIWATVPLLLLPQESIDLSILKNNHYFHSYWRIKKFGRSQSRVPQIPIPNNDSKLIEKSLLEELNSSWKMYHMGCEYSLGASRVEILGILIPHLENVRSKRSETEQKFINSITQECLSHSSLFDLCYQVNRVPGVVPIDIAKIYLNKSILSQFNPFSSSKWRDAMHQISSNYMQLCSLEDKLSRICWIFSKQSTTDAQILTELRCERLWIPENYPRWLVFEVEQGIQIRPEQYILAKHLLDNPGSISQMNMGLGKTRVVLPMLILELTSDSKRSLQSVVRLHLLRSLLTEGLHYLQTTLTASIMRICIFQQPFHRQMPLTSGQIRVMRKLWDICLELGAVQILTPDHRLSLLLRQIDTASSSDAEANILSIELKKYLKKSELSLNIFDESDALLRHRYQLVYAVGTPSILVDASTRASMIQAVLCSLNYLNSPKVETSTGMFKPVKFLSEWDNEKLSKAVIERIVHCPIYELNWINECDTNLKDRIMICVADGTNPLGFYLNQNDLCRADFWKQICMLRGLLAKGILHHCLSLRHRVDYGICLEKKKCSAIPFLAADVPSERSEFNHPDVRLMLTHLSYFYFGLERDQLFDAVQCLLNLGPTAQKYHYKQWFAFVSSDGNLSLQEVKSIDSEWKLDLTNTEQSEVLYRAYKYCMEAINFWIRNCLVVSDSTQYPQRIIATSWNLPCSHSIGFSGTKDTHLLLPLLVEQREPDINSLLSTNGEMLDKIVHHSNTVLLGVSEGEAPWKSLLHLVLKNSLHAIIDVGSILAGISNRKAAEYLLDVLGDNSSFFKAITYFETDDGHSSSNGQWMMMQVGTKRIWPMQTSPIKERDTFVIFDDARSRGSDMKLKPEAVAGVTLGLRLQKEKLVQGVGRMRMLGNNQKIQFICPIEVKRQIHLLKDGRNFLKKNQDDRANAAKIVEWTLKNTTEYIEHGLLEWAQQGFIYAQTAHDSNRAAVDVNWTLESLYSHGIETKPVSELIANHARNLVDSMNGRMDLQELCNDIGSHGEQFGYDIVIETNSHNQECELEMEEEKEMEGRQDISHPLYSPVIEHVWEYSKVCAARTVDELGTHVTLLQFDKAIEESVKIESIGSIGWNLNQKIFVTDNFMKTVLVDKKNDCSYFLRRIDMLLVFQNGAIVLLSDQEGDAALEAYLNCSTTPHNYLCNLVSLASFVRSERFSTSREKVSWGIGYNAYKYISENDLAALLLFNGWTMFTFVPKSLNVLLDILPNKCGKKAASEMVQARGMGPFFLKSDLEKICTSIR